jgi:hypothetical protein
MSNADIIKWFRNGGECAERGEQCRVIEAASGCNCALTADTITALEARVKELEGVLKWYADKGNYKRRSYPNEDRFYPALIEYDEGEKARAALSQPAPNRETDWGPDVGNEILPPPPEKGGE